MFQFAVLQRAGSAEAWQKGEEEKRVRLCFFPISLLFPYFFLCRTDLGELSATNPH